MDRNPIALETVEELGHRDPGRIDSPAALHFRDQARALDLRLSLVACKTVPDAPALAGGVTAIKDDRPMSG
jgi:hypothetical protein